LRSSMCDAPMTLSCVSEPPAQPTSGTNTAHDPAPPSSRGKGSPAGRAVISRGASDTNVLLPNRRLGSSAYPEMTREQLQFSLLHLQTDHSSMTQQLARLKKDKAQAQQETEELRSQLRQLERELDSYRGRAEALSAQLQSHAAQLDEARSDLAAANAALARAQQVVPPAGGGARLPGSGRGSGHVALEMLGECGGGPSLPAASSRLSAPAGFASGRRRAPGERIWVLPLRWALWAIGAGGVGAAGGAAGRLQPPRQRAIGRDTARAPADRRALMSV
jgi:hypothetical protein